MTPSRMPADVRRGFEEAVKSDFGLALSVADAEEAATRVLRVVKLVATILAHANEGEALLTTSGNKRDCIET